MTMRYMLFGYDAYYPSGGASDFLASFPDVSQAVEYVHKTCGDRGSPGFYQLYDAEGDRILWEVNSPGSSDPHGGWLVNVYYASSGEKHRSASPEVTVYWSREAADRKAADGGWSGIELRVEPFKWEDLPV